MDTSKIMNAYFGCHQLSNNESYKLIVQTICIVKQSHWKAQKCCLIVDWGASKFKGGLWSDGNGFF